MPSPKIYGLIGYPVKHSLSALMHNAAFKARDISAKYKLFEIKPEELEDFLLKNIRLKDTKEDSFFSQEISGFNITIPHKIKAREILDKKYPLVLGKLPLADQYYVKLSGAINTVSRENGQLAYYNTDAWGFSTSLELDDKKEGWGLGFDSKNKSALILGSGGAGRAVISSLSWKGRCVKIYVYEKESRAIDSAKHHFFEGDLAPEWTDMLRSKLEFISIEKIPETLKKCDLLVNASPVGMQGNGDSVIDKVLFQENPRLSVYDVVYNRETQLVKDARSVGLAAVGGLGMLLYQGAAAFELWTGEKAPIEIMRKELTEGVSK